VCKVSSDCQSTSVCKSGVCTSKCADGIPDGAETGTDCGGGTCAGCALGANCNVPGDCASGTCGIPDGGTAKICL
jgi:hypothetical protein